MRRLAGLRPQPRTIGWAGRSSSRDWGGAGLSALRPMDWPGL